MYEDNHTQFFTATNYQWKSLIKDDKAKDIIIESLRFLVKENRALVYSFVIMDNHLHIIWRIKTPFKLKDVQRDFLKYTAQQIKFYLFKNDLELIEECKVGHKDRQYKIWQSDSLSVDLYSEKVFKQKMDYLHNNPVKAGLSVLAEEYKYSSAKNYVLNHNEWDFITKYEV